MYSAPSVELDAVSLRFHLPFQAILPDDGTKFECKQWAEALGFVPFDEERLASLTEISLETTKAIISGDKVENRTIEFEIFERAIPLTKLSLYTHGRLPGQEAKKQTATATQNDKKDFVASHLCDFVAPSKDFAGENFSVQLLINQVGTGVLTLHLDLKTTLRDGQALSLDTIQKIVYLISSVKKSAKLQVQFLNEPCIQQIDGHEVEGVQKVQVIEAKELDELLVHGKYCNLSNLLLMLLPASKATWNSQRLWHYTVITIKEDKAFSHNLIETFKPFLFGLSQSQEVSHAGYIDGVTSSIFKTISSAHVVCSASFGQVHLLHQQYFSNGVSYNFNSLRHNVVTYRYYFVYLYALAQGISLKNLADRVDDLICRKDNNYSSDAARQMHRHFANYLSRAGGQFVSTQDSYQEVYNVSRECFKLDTILEHVRSAIREIDEVNSAEQNIKIANLQSESIGKLVQLQEKFSEETKQRAIDNNRQQQEAMRLSNLQSESIGKLVQLQETFSEETKQRAIDNNRQQQESIRLSKTAHLLETFVIGVYLLEVGKEFYSASEEGKVGLIIALLLLSMFGIILVIAIRIVYEEKLQKGDGGHMDSRLVSEKNESFWDKYGFTISFGVGAFLLILLLALSLWTFVPHHPQAHGEVSATKSVAEQQRLQPDGRTVNGGEIGQARVGDTVMPLDNSQGVETVPAAPSLEDEVKTQIRKAVTAFPD